jgi:competence protein ComEA
VPRDLSNSLQKGLFLFCLLILCFLTLGWAFRKGDPPPGPGSDTPAGTVIIEIGEGFERPGLYRYSKAPEVLEVARDAGGLVYGLSIPGPVWKTRLEKDGTLKWAAVPGGKVTFELAPLSVRALWLLGRPLPLNRVSEQDLDRLPGIGPVMASRIIEYRQSGGGFSSLEELKQVNGIKEKTFEKIKDYFTL